MKFISRTFLSTAILLLSHQVAAENILCPTIQEVKSNTKFIRIETGLMPWWVSQTFSSQGNDWTVFMSLKNAQFDTQQEALKQGQAIFDTRVELMTPRVETNSSGTICYFTYTQNDSADYLVLAVNPPVSFSFLKSRLR